MRVRCLDTNLDGREVAAAIRSGCDRLVHIGPGERGAAAMPARADLLIDLNGHTDGARTDLLASSRAPVRTLAVAYPASLGGHGLVHYLAVDAPSVWPSGCALPPSRWPLRRWPNSLSCRRRRRRR